MIRVNEKVDDPVQSIYFLLDNGEKSISFAWYLFLCLFLLFHGGWRKHNPGFCKASRTIFIFRIPAVYVGRFLYVLIFFGLLRRHASFSVFIFIFLAQAYFIPFSISRWIYVSGCSLLFPLVNTYAWRIFHTFSVARISRIRSASALLDQIDFRLNLSPSGALL